MRKNFLNTHNSLFFSLLALLCWLPLPLGSNRPWSEAVFFVTIALLSTGVFVSITLKKIRLPKSLAAARYMQLCFMLLIGWQILQSLLITPANPQDMQLGLLLSISYWLLFNLVIILANTEQHFRLLLWTLVASGLFQACYGTLMTLSGIEWGFFGEKAHGHGVATGTFVNRNHLAGYLEMTLAIGLGLLIGQLKDIQFQSLRQRLQHYMETLLSSKIILRVALAAMVIGLIMTRSRMGNTAFFSSLLICGLLYMWLRQRFSRSALILFASLILIDTLIVSQWFGLEKLAQRLDSTIEQLEVTESGTETANRKSQEYLQIKTGDARDNTWRESLPMALDAGPLGRGYYSFKEHFPQYRDGSSRMHFRHAHNDYIELNNDFGWIGFSLLMALALQGFVISIQAQRQRHKQLAISAGFGSMMGIMCIAMHSFTDFNLYIPANAALMCALLAIAVTARWGKLKKG